MIPFIFLLAFALRVYALITPAIWYDEAFSFKVATMPFPELIAFRDFMPPLWEIILHPFLRLSPTIEMMRTVTLAFSMLTLAVVYFITHELKFSQARTALTLVTVAFLPGLLWMGTDGRAYALLTFLYTCGIYAVITNRRIAVLIFSALMVLTHLVGCVLVATLYIHRMIKDRRLHPDPFLILLLWIPLYLRYSQTPGYGIDKLTAPNYLLQWTMAAWVGTPQWLWLFAFFITISLLIIARNDWTGIFYHTPYVFMIGISLVTASVIHYRTLSPALVPFALVIGSLADGRIVKRIGALVWIVLLISGVYLYDFNAKGSAQREAAAMIAADPAPMVYQTLTVALPFDYYLDAGGCILQTKPNGALSYHLLGFDPCKPDDVTAPYWLIVADEPKIPPEAVAQVAPLWQDAMLRMKFKYPQIHPVKVYRK